MPPSALDRRKNPPKSANTRSTLSNLTIMSSPKGVLKKVLSVALPFCATATLGGGRVALVMLVALTSGIVTLEDRNLDLSHLKGWKQLIVYRRWTLVSILLQVSFDVAGLTNPAELAELAVGYSALASSVFALPPPFPSIVKSTTANETDFKSPQSASVVLSSGFETQTAAELGSLRKTAVSPLVCTAEDSDLTIQAGVLSTALCCLLFFFSGLQNRINSAAALGMVFLAACATTLCLLVIQPHSLQDNKKLGFLLGAITSTILCFFNSAQWRYPVYQGVLLGISFLAIQIDTPTVLAIFSRSKQDADHRHHTHNNTTEVASTNQHSKFTQYLLDTLHPRPLLRSILIEKDSRRIFYFMWLAPYGCCSRRHR